MQYGLTPARIKRWLNITGETPPALKTMFESWAVTAEGLGTDDDALNCSALLHLLDYRMTERMAGLKTRWGDIPFAATADVILRHGHDIDTTLGGIEEWYSLLTDWQHGMKVEKFLALEHDVIPESVLRSNSQRNISLRRSLLSLARFTNTFVDELDDWKRHTCNRLVTVAVSSNYLTFPIPDGPAELSDANVIALLEQARDQGGDSGKAARAVLAVASALAGSVEDHGPTTPGVNESLRDAADLVAASVLKLQLTNSPPTPAAAEGQPELECLGGEEGALPTSPKPTF